MRLRQKISPKSKLVTARLDRFDPSDFLLMGFISSPTVRLREVV